MLETPEQSMINNQNKLDKQKWLNDFLRGVDPPSEQEKNDSAIAEVLADETEPTIDGKTENIFIDDNEVFDNDDMTETDKEYIQSLIDKTNFYDDQDIDFKAVDDVPDSDDDAVYIKTVPPPPNSPNPPLHLRQRPKSE